MRRAKEQAKARGKEASEAKDKAQTLEERISALRKLIDAEKKVLQASRQKVDLVRQNVATMRKERRSLQQKPDDNRAKLDALDEQISDASDQEQKESMEVRNSTDRLNNLQKTLN